MEFCGFGIILVLGCICGLVVVVNFDNGWVLWIFILIFFRGLNIIELGCSCIGDVVELMVGVVIDFGDKRFVVILIINFIVLFM